MWRNAGVLRLLRRHDTGEMGELREQLRGRADQALRMVRMEVAFDLADLDPVERLDREQGIDEKAVAARCRDRGRPRYADWR